jgi:hypothetical protein
MVELGNHPRPVVYDSVPYYDPNQVVTPFANNPDFIRYKIGRHYFVYDVRRSTPSLISIHALVSRFERFLRGHG